MMHSPPHHHHKYDVTSKNMLFPHKIPCTIQLPIMPCHLSWSSASHTTQLHEQTLRSYSSTPPALFPGWSDKGEGHVILSAGPLVLFPLAPFHTAVCAQMAPPEPEPPAVSLISMNREPGTGNVTTSTRKHNTANTFPPPETRSGPEHATYRIQGHCKPLEQEGRDGPYRLL